MGNSEFWNSCLQLPQAKKKKKKSRAKKLPLFGRSWKLSFLCGTILGTCYVAERLKFVQMGADVTRVTYFRGGNANV